MLASCSKSDAYCYNKHRSGVVEPLLLIAMVIGGGWAADQIGEAYFSPHKKRELNMQKGMSRTQEVRDDPIARWKPEEARGEFKTTNLFAGPVAYDRIDADSTMHSILRVFIEEANDDDHFVSVWLDEERADGFRIESAIIRAGSRFRWAEIVSTDSFNITHEQASERITVWNAKLLEDMRSLEFRYEIDGEEWVAKGRMGDQEIDVTTERLKDGDE